MKKVVVLLSIMTVFMSCNKNEQNPDLKIIFLHHSTGAVIWNGGPRSLVVKILDKINKNWANKIEERSALPKLFKKYNEDNNKNYQISELEFPKASPYGWNNNPFDYYNIWVKNAGLQPYMEEPTLEILTKEYDVIIFKHCYPVSNIQPDNDSADIDSWYHSISNYKLQYDALKEKLHEFAEIKFILFTGAAQVKANVTEDEAKRAKEFFGWVINEWDIPGDNIFIWDLYSLETDGGIYLKDDFSISQNDSHPNKMFASRAVNMLFTRIVDIIENNGDNTSLTGEKLISD